MINTVTNVAGGNLGMHTILKKLVSTIEMYKYIFISCCEEIDE